MEIESISHEALWRFVETGKPKGLPGDLEERPFKMVNFIINTIILIQEDEKTRLLL